MIRVAFPLVSALALAACTPLGPEPGTRPEISLPSSFDGSASSPAQVQVGRAFWGDYRDPVLNGLLARGLGQSLSILAANERIRAAEAGVRAAAPLAAQLGGTATAGRERVGADGISSSAATSSALSAAFVIDLFGSAYRTRQGAAADLAATEARAMVTRQAYIAEVISAYSGARLAQEQLALTRSSVTSRERTVEITRSRMGVGSATQFELAQVEALLELTRADIPAQRARFDAQVIALSVLLNEPVDRLAAELRRGAPQLRVPAGPGTGVPADLLRNRPDLRAAEQDLAAATARVGVAEAALLPSISLVGRVSDVGSSNSWGFGPQLSLPVFNSGALLANRDSRLSAARQAEIAWRQSVASAVGSVQTAQSNLRRYRQQVSTLQGALEAYERAHALAEQNYEAGALPLLDLLEVDRTRATTRQALAAARHQAALEWSALQIAVGAEGGAE